MDWIAGWSKRIKLTIDHTKVNSDLTNFPVLVNLDTTCSGVFNELGNNSKKISFINPSNHEQYFCEIERWDSLNQSAQLWVKLPTVVSGTDTEFYMLYDNTQEDNTSYIGDTADAVSNNVWNESFGAVYHMSQDPSIGGACILDSTTNYNHGTPNGSMTSEDVVDGLVGKALDFDGNDDHIDLPSTIMIDTTYSFSFYLEPATTSTIQLISNQSSYENGRMSFTSTGISLYANGSDFTTLTHGVTSIDKNYYCITRNGSTCKLYVNGLLADTTTNLTATDSLQINCLGGKHFSTAWVYLEGAFSQMCFLDTVLSDSWVKTTYYSNTDVLITKTEEVQPVGELNYQNRIKLSIPYNYIENSLYNFPVLVNLSSSSGLNNEDVTEVFKHLGTTINRKKIAITNYTGVAQLYVEIERWSQAEHSAQLWVKIPEVFSNSDTVLYLYYDVTKSDNSLFIGDTASWPAQNVWDDNFVAVYHMSQDPSTGGACILDSTSNTNHGTPEGIVSSSSLVDSQVGKAINFNGSDNLINLGHIFDPINETLEATIKTGTSSTNANIGILCDHYPSYVRGFLSIRGLDSYKLQVGFYANSSWYSVNSSITGLNDREYYHTSMVYNKTNLISYVNGESTSIAFSENLSTEDTDWRIGAKWDVENNGGWFEGIIDEVRLSNVARSDTWITTTYKSNSDSLICFTTYDQTGWLETYENGELSPWAKRIKLEIDNTNVDIILNDFPLLVNINKTSGYNNKDTRELLTTISGSYKKIAITSEDGITQLPIEIECYAGDIDPKWQVEHSAVYTKATTTYNTSYLPHFATDPELSTLGAWTFTSWISDPTNSYTNQKFNMDYTTPFILYSILLVNGHHIGVGTNKGIKNFSIYGSNSQSAFDDVTYASTTDLTLLGTFVASEHLELDVHDPQQFIINATTPFRYYVLRIADCYSSTNYMSIRSIQLRANSDSLQLWTKIPIIKPHEKTTLYLYYDQTKSDNAFIGDIGSTIGKEVWSNNYTGVWHLSQTATVVDSVRNTLINGTPTGMTYHNQAEGNIGRAQLFNGISNVITVADHGFLHIVNNSTIEIILNATTDSVNRRNPLNKAYGGEFTMTHQTAGYNSMYYGTSGGDTTPYARINFDYNDDEWDFVALTKDFTNSTFKTFNSGVVFQEKVPEYSALVASTADMLIGNGYTDYFLGSIKSIRLSTVARSDEWVKFTYSSDTDAAVFYNSVETYTVPEDLSYFYHGYIKEKGEPVERVALLYNNTTGILVDSTVSDAGGYYLLETPDNEEHFIVVMDDGAGTVYDPIVQDKLLPNGK